MSIKHKFIISYLILILFTVSTLGFLIGKKSDKAVFNEVKEKIETVTELLNTTMSICNELLTDSMSNNLKFTELNLVDKLDNNFDNFAVDNSDSIKVGNFDLPVLYGKRDKISLNTSIVDDIKESTGTIASIFLLHDDKLIRVSTNLIKDNKRAEGSYITSDTEIYKQITSNNEYTCTFEFDGQFYISAYKALLDKNNNIIGAIGLGYNVLNKHLEKSINDIKIGTTGYIYIIDSKGNEIVHPSNKGDNISKYDFVKKIIANKNGTIEYTFNGVHKLSYYKYFEPWDWYIVATANYDDLKTSSEIILNTVIIIGALTSFFGIILALIMTNVLVKPIHKLKSYMDTVTKGDLSVRSDINSKDEIGSLSNSFNRMIAENNRLFQETIQYDNLKTEFIANMSHELRTPLNIIFSTVQLFGLYINKGESLSVDKLRKHTNNITQNCYRLLRLVNNLIDITKIDSGYMELDFKNQNIVEIAEDITLSTAEYVETLNRSIIFDTNVEEKIMSFDAEKLERILLNLISNSLKFTKYGDTIEVKVYDKGTHVVISVKDNGLGIPQDKLSQIFERFKQINPLLSRSHEGSGIGLSIVQSLVQMHNGTITVKSNCNEGTEFIISLPAKCISSDCDTNENKDLTSKTNVEKIHIEFSDIYH